MLSDGYQAVLNTTESGNYTAYIIAQQGEGQTSREINFEVLFDIEISEEPEPEEEDIVEEQESPAIKEDISTKIQNLPSYEVTWTPEYTTEEEEEEEEIIEVEVELQGVNTNGVATMVFNQALEIPEVVFSANFSRFLVEVDLDEYLGTII